MHEDEQKRKGNDSDGQIHVETPSPRSMLSESATYQRARDGRYAKDHSKKALEHGTLVERYHGDDGHHGAGPDASRADSCDRTTDDKGIGIGCSAAQR